MLKWTVNNRRLSVANDYATSSSDLLDGHASRQRRLSSGALTPLPKHYGGGGGRQSTTGSESCSAVAKRRRSEVIRRRSTTLNNQWKNRHSLCLDFQQGPGKENDAGTGGCSTSTPIKSSCTGNDDAPGSIAALEAFRDVSNLTPTAAMVRPRVAATSTGRRSSLLSLKKCRSDSKVHSQLKKKGKKQCLDAGRHHRGPPLFGNSASEDCTNYFRTFEAVDSHITSKYVDSDMCCIVNKAKAPNGNANYASTLPSLAMESDSPLGVLNSQSQLRNLLVDNGDGDPPKKRLKFAHVNDFLQQISFPSTSSLKVKNSMFPGYKLNNNETFFGGARVSPLVNKLINLRFSNNNDSSFINDLSLDKIVTAILDTSSKNEDSTNMVVQFEAENEINETLEENIINTANEQLIVSVSSEDKNSSDSGFRTSTTEIIQQVHAVDTNFHCKCALQNNSQGDETYINIEETFNERCVDTPHEDFTLKRRRCVRRKRPYEDNAYENTYTITPKRQASQESSQSERFSPESKSSPYNDDSFDSSYDRQLTFRILEPQSIKRRTRRCLLFESPEDMSLDIGARLREISSLRNNCNELFNLGYMDLNMQYENDVINLYVNQCHNLPMIHGVPVNAYVKVLLTQRPYVTTGAPNSVTMTSALRYSPQRTAVQSESRSPTFRHVFQFTVPTTSAGVAPPQDGLTATDTTSGMLLLMEVWHRDRINRCSEFIGCMSFNIPDAIETAIHGSYHLLPQSCGRYYNVRLNSDVSSSPSTSTFTVRPCNADSYQDNTIISSNLIRGPTKPLQQQYITAHRQSTAKRKPTGNMCESQSSVEDGFGYDDIDNELLKNMAGSSNSTKAALSQYQRDADENIFLRYLELDPTEGPDAIPAATQRKAVGARNSGRTPFTSTRVISRPPKSGYGFSVVWTNPPRIERVEKGLPAERAGILPGDYLIFVDKQNVVMMPELDILNLIRSCGNQLTLEIYRKPSTRNGSASNNNTGICTASVAPPCRDLPSRQSSILAAIAAPVSLFGLPPAITIPTAPASTITTITQRRPSTVCSTNTVSVDYTASQSRRTDVGGAGVGGGGHSSASGMRLRRPMQLPHVVTFNTEKYSSADDARRKAMYQLIHKEQQYVTALQFAISRFVIALQDRKDLITQAEHKILFQNSEEILRLSEGIIEHLVHEDGDYHTRNLLRVYHCKLSEMGSVYKRYCAGIKKADLVLANKTKNSNSEFVDFLQNPEIPRRRPDITVFIHKPLQHFREVLKLFHVMLSNTKSNYDDYPVISQIVNGLQSIYREMTTEAGLMEPVGEGKPLLSVQDLENRLVFTKCKPFILSKPGRQWIFGGDLSRIEGRNVRQYWTLLFSDILLFAKVSRDRVLFILEDPLPLTHISELCFNVRKKATEFRILAEPNACKAVSSPTVHCGPDLSRTPRKNPAKKCIILRAPTIELKAVWQNLLQRQIFHISASGGGGGGGSAGTGACDGSSFNSTPLDSPLGADDTLCTDRCDVPLSMNAALLQRSAESLSTGTAAATAAAAAAASVPPAGRRQVRLMTDTNTSGCDRDPCGSCGPQSYQHPVVVGSSCSSSPVLSLAHVHCALPAPRSHCCQQLHTPETPSANITRNSSSSTSTASSTSSMNSQAFTSHFNSETSLLLPQSSPPSAILTPSTDASHANINMLSDEPWDLTNFEYEFTLNIDDYFK